jgi:hypothetical protein
VGIATCSFTFCWAVARYALADPLGDELVLPLVPQAASSIIDEKRDATVAILVGNRFTPYLLRASADASCELVLTFDPGSALPEPALWILYPVS